MSLRTKLFVTSSTVALLAALLACSGMSGSDGGGVPVGGSGSNALDAVATGNEGIQPAGGGQITAGGAAVPSTQQSEPGIGGPCGMSIKFLVRVIEDGYLRYCDGRQGPRAEFVDAIAGVNDAVMAKSLRRGEAFDPNNADMYDEPDNYTPKVKVDFVPADSSYFTKHELIDAKCQSDGLWAATTFFRWGHGADGRLCGEYRLSASATLRASATNYSSATWFTNSVPLDSEGYPAPVTLVIEQGQ